MFCLSQLRQTVFQFFQKELAPKAATIDRNNEFAEMKVNIFLFVQNITISFNDWLSYLLNILYCITEMNRHIYIPVNTAFGL